MIKNQLINDFLLPEKWLDQKGAIIDCENKVKMLNENLTDLYISIKDTLDDAKIMGCCENYVKDLIINIVKKT